jgi:HSP20 family protein
MSLIKWSPFAPFFDQTAFENMDKLFDEAQSSLPMTRGSQSLVPPIDMYETETSVVVETPMPGIDPKRLDISIENGILSIKATSERKTEVDDKNYYRKEVRYGSVFRQIALPNRVIADKTEAVYEQGVLKLTMPKVVNDSGAVKVQIKGNS